MRWRGIACTPLALLALACRPLPETAMAEPLPTIPVYAITPSPDSSGLVIARSPIRDPLSGLGATRRVTLTAHNADVRTLLLWLAQEAGVSLVVAPDVAVRVSVNFNDVPAGEAMRAVLAEAGLSVLLPGTSSAWPPVVFRQMPVNINEVDVDGIVARFGVSREMAEWIVENRSRP